MWGDDANGVLGLGTVNNFYTTPRHLLPPAGQHYEAIDTDGIGSNVVAVPGSTAPGVVPDPSTWILPGAGVDLLGPSSGWR